MGLTMSSSSDSVISIEGFALLFLAREIGKFFSNFKKIYGIRFKVSSEERKLSFIGERSFANWNRDTLSGLYFIGISNFVKRH